MAKSKPAIKCAANEPPIHAKKAAPVTIRNTDFEIPRISRTSRLELPSNKIMATAKEIIGL